MTVINNNKVIIICNNYYKLKKINDKIIPTKVFKYIAWSRPWWLYFTAFPQPFSSGHILHNSRARKCNPSNTFHTRDLSGPQERAKHGRAWGHERDWMNDPQSQGVWDWVDRETANVSIKSPAPALWGGAHYSTISTKEQVMLWNLWPSRQQGASPHSSLDPNVHRANHQFHEFNLSFETATDIWIDLPFPWADRKSWVKVIMSVSFLKSSYHLWIITTDL